jgi:O-succinylbenzoic acid--CoA ligase
MIPCPVARAEPNKVAVVDEHGTVFTYGALDAHAARAAGALRAEGWSGACVAVRAQNGVHVVALHVAAARTGTTLVPLNLRLTPAEQDQQAARMRTRAVLDDDAIAALRGIAPGARHAVNVAAASSPVPLAAGAPARVNAVAALSPDHETVLLTSGTSGLAKGARLPLAAFVASANACAPMLRSAPDDAWLLCLPLFHVGALAMMWRSVLSGAVLRLRSASDIDGIARLLVGGEVTQASFVAATLVELLPNLHKKVSARVKAVLVGGGPVPDDLLVDARARGVPALWTWGLTEACSQVATARLDDSPRARGLPLPGNRVRVVDAARRPLVAGHAGEIAVQGPTLFRGYVDDDDATAAALPGDGWLRTRDVGVFDDDGALTVLARRTDLIVSGGENLYPAAIEQALARCPAVVDVAVIPVADARWGQRPVALIVLRRGYALEEVRGFAAHTLSRLAQPDRYAVVDALPRNALPRNALPRNALGKLERAKLPRLLT